MNRRDEDMDRRLLAGLAGTTATHSEECPYCGQNFQALIGMDPLRKHFDYCPERPSA